MMEAKVGGLPGGAGGAAGVAVAVKLAIELPPAAPGRAPGATGPEGAEAAGADGTVTVAATVLGAGPAVAALGGAASFGTPAQPASRPAAASSVNEGKTAWRRA